MELPLINMAAIANNNSNPNKTANKNNKNKDQWLSLAAT